MVLVDTSVLIDVLKNKRTTQAKKFDEIIENNIPYGICNYVYQELLQGVRSENQWQLLKNYLDTQRFYELKNGRESYAAAAKLFFRCQRAGVTIRKTIDVLISQIALENNLRLLHNDSDFARLMTVEKRLLAY